MDNMNPSNKQSLFIFIDMNENLIFEKEKKLNMFIKLVNIIDKILRNKKTRKKRKKKREKKKEQVRKK